MKMVPLRYSWWLRYATVLFCLGIIVSIVYLDRRPLQYYCQNFHAIQPLVSTPKILPKFPNGSYHTLEDAIASVSPVCFPDISMAPSFRHHCAFINSVPLDGLRDDYDAVQYFGFDQQGRPYEEDPLNRFYLPEFDNDENKGTIAIFRNAFIGGEAMIVFDCNVIWSQGGCHPVKTRDAMVRFLEPSVYSAKRIVVPGDAVLIYQLWGKGYYHFLIEDFVRLALVYDYLMRHPQAKIITYFPDYAGYLFELIGLSTSRIVPVNVDHVYAVETLLVPTATACGQMQSVAGRFMSQLVRTSYVAQMGNVTRGDILLHRRRGKRELLNHGELLQALQSKFGATHRVVEFEAESFARTIPKHMAADLIIGPHGAGFSNLIFATPGTGVIEIHPARGNGPKHPAKVNFCHMVTCERLGMRCRGIETLSRQFMAPIDRVLELATDLLNHRDGTE